MNITLIKQEIERLNSIVSAWNEGESVSAIERDLALSKLANLYELVRFGENNSTVEVGAPVAPVAAVAPAQTTAEEPENVTEDDEQEVEVEIIFAEEDEDFGSEETDEEENEEVEKPTVAPAVEVSPAVEPTVEPEPEVEVTPQPEPVQEPAPEPTPTPTPTPTPAPVVEATPAAEPEPINEPAPAPQPEPTPTVEQQPAERPKRKPSMESLFGADEIQRKPRSKHQRMMAIYSDPQQKPEKVVDISKIFDIDEDENFEISVSSNTPAAKHVNPNTVNNVATNETTILADTIAPATTTLADTIVAPAPLAEELTSARTTSLRRAIGLNDKFLMTRDLFDGDNEAFEEAISALDECETLDDCMIYIVENYEWNPDSEGAKFIMQLLERKHS